MKREEATSLWSKTAYSFRPSNYGQLQNSRVDQNVGLNEKFYINRNWVTSLPYTIYDRPGLLSLDVKKYSIKHSVQ